VDSGVFLSGVRFWGVDRDGTWPFWVKRACSETLNKAAPAAA
jgi:hypothetical protein